VSPSQQRKRQAGRILPALAVAAIAAVAALAAFVVAPRLNDQSASGSAGASAGTAASPSTSAPPSAAARNSFLNKPEPTYVATDPPTPTPSGAAADVLITWTTWNAAGHQLELGALVQAVSESGGTCTVTLTKDGHSVTASAPAEADVSSTGCLGLTVSGDKLSSGSWKAAVSYSSAKRRGTSDPVQVNIP